MINIFLFKHVSYNDTKLKEFCIQNDILLHWVGYSIVPIEHIGPLFTTWKVDITHKDQINAFLRVK